jgi:Zn-dependent protease
MNFRYVIKILLYTIVFLIIYFINETFLYYIPFIIIHELVHCFTAIMLGYSVNNIRMLPFGISASLNEEFITPLDDILISVSGPLINFIFFIVFLLLSNKDIHLFMLSQSNLILCIFNLIPAGFLDGGRILKNILKIYISFYSAYSINNINGIILGCLIVFAVFLVPLSFKSVISIIMGIFFIYTGYTSQKQIIINIIKDSLNKGEYIKKLNKNNEYTVIFKVDCKLMDVMKYFCFGKYYIIYINIDCKSHKILNEKEILKAYLRFGNIMLSEVGK